MMEFPWPYHGLSPNDKCHWAKKDKAFKKYKNDCRLLTNLPKPEKLPVHLYITFHPRVKRVRDVDNLLASCKALLDGVSEAWGINDSLFRPITIDIGDLDKRGKVVIEIIKK